jgi:hypothetical protein
VLCARAQTLVGVIEVCDGVAPGELSLARSLASVV